MTTNDIMNYKLKDFAKSLNVPIKPLQRLDNQDIISILHIFSCKLYVLREYKSKIGKDEEIAKEL